MCSIQQATTASLKNLFIGDALSMPVHWFYRRSDIIKYFPPHGVRKMEAAPADHPSSIMSLHSTATGGRRGSKPSIAHNASKHHEIYKGEVVGDIILKGKRDLWGQPRVHYHHGMEAGDNTLNACCARLMIKHLTETQTYKPKEWLENYIEFMTAYPAQHPDTYAESYHRGFFANLKRGKSISQCGSVSHDTPSMGALVTVAPLAFSLFKNHSLENVQAVCRTHVQLTHPDDSLMKVVDAYVLVLHTLLTQYGSEQKTLINKPHYAVDAKDVEELFVSSATAASTVKLGRLLSNNTDDSVVVGGQFSTACYISDSWPSVCYLAAKYFRSPQKALLVNTNLGGENAHRGAVLGTLVGIASAQIDDSMFEQLLHAENLNHEIQQFVNTFFPSLTQ